MATLKYICGIDPGNSGGLVILGSDNKIVYKLHFNDTKNKFKQREFRKALIKVKKLNCSVILENVHSMFQMSAKSNFSFGHVNGFIEGTLYAYSIPYIKIAPKIWQKVAWLGIPEKFLAKKTAKGRSSKDTKGMSLEAVHRLFPSVDLRKSLRSSKFHDGLVDALLIAYYGFKSNI